MSEIKVNKISPKQTCTQLTLGDSGDTIIIPAGATITNNGTATGFGRTGSVNWDTTPKTTTVTAVSGTGYFVNTTSGAITVNLPAGVAGDIVAISDYANTAATNNITITPNGTDKINGTNQPTKITTNGASATLLYVDSTRGWKDINDATLDLTGIPPFVVATGGTITTCGNYKIHTFTGPGTFTVTNAGTPAGSTTVDYLVVAGGGGGGGDIFSTAGGAGGAGGFRYSNSTFPVSGAPGAPLASATALPVTATAYPITVGGGGAGGTSPTFPIRGTAGSPSIFSTITSAGGGEGNGSGGTPDTDTAAGNGGSGGGARNAPAGSGNTPPVSPSQGNPGGASGVGGPLYSSGGGGGAMEAGSNGSAPVGGGPGGVGSGLPNAFGTSGQPSGGYYYFSGGGGGGIWTNVPAPQAVGPYGQGGLGGGGNGGQYTTQATGRAGVAGTTNTGGGGGGASGGPSAPSKTNGGSGGSGIVIIRYLYQ